MLFALFPLFLRGILKGGGTTTNARGNPINSLKTQNFLESKPYWDHTDAPLDTYSIEKPFEGRVISCQQVNVLEGEAETFHVTINHGGNFLYREGQLVGVILPENANNSPTQNQKPQIYPLVSTRYGDEKNGKTLSLCVTRSPTSNHLCDFLSPGKNIMLTGPHGDDSMLFPEHDTTIDYIMIAEGAVEGLARFRGFIRRLFAENTRISFSYRGLLWLFCPELNEGNFQQSKMSYRKELDAITESFPDTFRVNYTLDDKDGGNLVNPFAEHAYGIYERLENGGHIFFSHTEPESIVMSLKKVCDEKTIDYGQWKEKLINNRQWHVLGM